MVPEILAKRYTSTTIAGPIEPSSPKTVSRAASSAPGNTARKHSFSVSLPLIPAATGNSGSDITARDTCNGSPIAVNLDAGYCRSSVPVAGSSPSIQDKQDPGCQKLISPRRSNSQSFEVNVSIGQPVNLAANMHDSTSQSTSSVTCSTLPESQKTLMPLSVHILNAIDGKLGQNRRSLKDNYKSDSVKNEGNSSLKGSLQNKESIATSIHPPASGLNHSTDTKSDGKDLANLASNDGYGKIVWSLTTPKESG
ncbi:unnamed protein product [Protopolystoma xenopodis]|uniref:Uncharacterized protein n=1 Tax=Protopolystoma xenopodis TaxID=117903 RepID=A0A3S5ALS7_9PLAT|nr:unnamed protein product [Protopolystoma xenopodis]